MEVGLPELEVADDGPGFEEPPVREDILSGRAPDLRERRVTERGSSNLMRGTVDLVVLRTLVQGAMHGFAIARWIREHAEDALSFEDAALYQSLHRLERRGLVESSWGRSENNRRARFYTLTRKGKRHLEAEAEAFRSYASAITRLLEHEG